jgi:hypothetical protein
MAARASASRRVVGIAHQVEHPAADHAGLRLAQHDEAADVSAAARQHVGRRPQVRPVEVTPAQVRGVLQRRDAQPRQKLGRFAIEQYLASPLYTGRPPEP